MIKLSVSETKWSSLLARTSALNRAIYTTGSPESQQHTGSQIIRICMEIYLKIDRTVKMYKKVYIRHKKLCLCCFLTVSCPINAILASFNVLVSQLLRKIQGKTRLYYAARRKSYKNYLHSTPIAPKLRLSTESWFPFLENFNLVPNIKQWPQEGEKCR